MLRKPSVRLMLLTLPLLLLASCQAPATSQPTAPVINQPTATVAEPALAPSATTAPAVSATETTIPTQAEATSTEPPQASPTTAPTTVTVPADWQTIVDPIFGFEYAYPAGWEFCTVTENSRVFCEVDPSGGAGFPVFYSTIVPLGFTNADATAYNFLPENVLRQLAATPVGTSVATAADPTYSTFTRLDDIEVNGQRLPVIENSRVWQGDETTKDRRVLITTADAIIMLGAYYETPEELEQFNTIVQTFRLPEE